MPGPVRRSLFFTGIVNSLLSLFLLRLLTGVAQGIYFSNDRPVIVFYTPKEKASLGQGVSFIGLGLRMFFGILFTGIISEKLGWRWVFILYPIPSFIAAFLILKIIKEPLNLETTAINCCRRANINKRFLWDYL